MKPFIVVATLPVLPTLWLLAQVGSNAPAPVSTPFENMGQVWLALIMLATTVYNKWSSSREAARNRVWQIEDRKVADLKAEVEAKKIREDLLAEATRIRDEAWRRADVLTDAVAENTALTRAVAGNGVKVALPIVPVKVTPMPDRRPDDSAPLVGRRETDPPPIKPTRRAEDADEEKEKP